MLFFFFLNYAWYAYLALFHVETNYTVCYVTALWAYFIHHWTWGLVFSFPIYKSNEKPPFSGMLGQNRGGLGGKSWCKTFLFQITRQWSGMDCSLDLWQHQPEKQLYQQVCSICLFKTPGLSGLWVKFFPWTKYEKSKKVNGPSLFQAIVLFLGRGRRWSTNIEQIHRALWSR